MRDEIKACLDAYRVLQPGPEPFDCISLAGTNALAGLLGVPPRQAMIFCLERKVWPLRFKGNRGALSAADQATLLRSHAAVIGCGGLGGHVILMLARLGVGALTLCDNDVFEESNLNRQILCREDRLGMNKAAAAKQELALTAAHASVRTFECEADADTLPDMLAGASLAIDCLDNLKTRRLVEEAAHNAGLSFIHGAIAGYEGFALTSRPAPGQAPALARLYGEAGFNKTEGAEVKAGVPTPTPAATAVLQVMLALRELLGPPGGQSDGIALQHLDLSVPSLDILLL